MPNGGSDNCGTCRFVQVARMNGRPSRSRCIIRGFDIARPYYTYCANHPYRRPEPDPIPTGPVFVAGEDHERVPAIASPDTDAVRAHLLALAAQIEAPPSSEYPIGWTLDEVVVWQLGELREPRAAEHLERILGFDPEAQDEKWQRTRAPLIALAEEALAQIRTFMEGR